MTVGFQIALFVEMPHWLEMAGLVSIEQWETLTQCLNFTATVGLH